MYSLKSREVNLLNYLPTSNTLNHLWNHPRDQPSEDTTKTFLKLNDAHTHATIRQARQEAVYRTAIPIITYALIFSRCSPPVCHPKPWAAVASSQPSSSYYTSHPVLCRLLASGIIREKVKFPGPISKNQNLSAEEKGGIWRPRLSLKIKISKGLVRIKPGLHVISMFIPTTTSDNWPLLTPIGKKINCAQCKAPSY